MSFADGVQALVLSFDGASGPRTGLGVREMNERIDALLARARESS